MKYHIKINFEIIQKLFNFKVILILILINIWFLRLIPDTLQSIY